LEEQYLSPGGGKVRSRGKQQISVLVVEDMSGLWKK
jgi:hypothetical protein